jgi:hypothetical protein
MNHNLIRQQIASLRHAHPELAEDEDGWLLTLESETDLTECLRAIERKRHEAAALAGGIESAIAELRERQERFERRESTLRGILFKLLQAAELRKKELPEATLSIREGVPKVILSDSIILSNDFIRIKREPDKGAIREALMNGKAVPGAVLSNAEPVLSIRVR